MSDASATASDPHFVARDANFDPLRFSLAAAVVFSHSYYVTGVREMPIGVMAVLGFFGISGFLVAQSWLRRRSALDYFRRRVLRIFPGFAGVVLFDHLVVAPLAAGSVDGVLRVPVWRVVREILTLSHRTIPGVFDDLPVHAVNGSLWSIPYEFICYTMLAVVGAVGLFHHPRRTLIAAIALWGFAGLVLAHPRSLWMGPIYQLLLPYVLAFSTGVVLSLYRDRLKFTRTRVVVVCVLLVLSLANKVTGQLFWPVGFPYVMIALGRHTTVPFPNFGRRGDFSYGLYLFAFPVQQLLVQALGVGVHPFALFAAAMVLTMPLAVFSWYAIEKPFLRLKG